LIEWITKDRGVVKFLDLPLEIIRPLPGVVQARFTGQRLEVDTRQPEETLAALSLLARQHNQRVGEVSMRQPDLEDVFLHHTGRTLEATLEV
jgi:hypothetical protein